MEGGSSLYFNARIHTMDPDLGVAGAMLVRAGRIVAIGTHHDLDGPGVRRIDLEGRTVVPGFNDSHCHILDFGLALGQLDVSADAVQSIADIQRAIAVRARETTPGGWITGRGYDQNVLRERRHPTRHDLDAWSSEHPVILFHTSGHVLTCNSAALALAGVDAGTADPAGGEIERNEHGAPTGLFKEAPAMDLVARLIPRPSVPEGAHAIARALQTMASFGITSASDAATGDGPSIEPQLAMYRSALGSGPCPVRVTLMPQIFYTAPPGEDAVRPASELDTGDAPEWLAIGATKIFSDGALSTRTAATREAYLDGADNRGILLWPQEELERMIDRANRAGWQIATHALGDRAVEAVVTAYEGALAAQPRPDHRHRIEHCMLLDEELATRIGALGVVPSLQPDIFRLGDGYVAALGVDRAAQSIPTGLFARLGIPVAFSSDAPVIPCDPLAVIRSAVERRTPAGVTLGREHAVTAMEALRNYTVGGAFATHAEREKGRLAAGMWADFVVLSRDPAQTAVEDLADVRVTMTVAGGIHTHAA
ncbi:MAG TPA: amidohydrolase [Chloroflexota bacterium]|nr:amidohydrolase [Chloroflexota bacterium]